jgi:hypothetical protein
MLFGVLLDYDWREGLRRPVPSSHHTFYEAKVPVDYLYCDLHQRRHRLGLRPLDNL